MMIQVFKEEAAAEHDRVYSVGLAMLGYLKMMGEMPDLPYSIYGLRPISEMLPIWEKELHG